ncbi:MAG: thiolase [Chloroflexi bacterium]|nr:thiolase [Chloroflexota bacterium]
MSNLKDKYAIVGVGETEYSRNSGRTTRALGMEAIRNAMRDAGLEPCEFDAMLSYHGNDSTDSLTIAGDLGIRLNFYMDCSGGGSSTEALIGLATGAIEAGMCETVVVFRAMNGYTEARIGGTGRQVPVYTGGALYQGIYGVNSAAQMFAAAFMRHMFEHGTTSEQIANVKAVHSRHASNNPKAFYKERVTVQDVLSSRWITRPLHLLDCCVETDNGTAIIVTSAERARDLRQKPAYIMAVAGRTSKRKANYHWSYAPITLHSGQYAGPRIFANAGVTPEDIDVTGAYDAFTFTPIFQLEAYGFCEPGGGGDYVTNGTIELGGKRPNNTSGGHLCEVYTHGMNMVIENVRQLRGLVDDYCPNWAAGEHTYDYSERGCRQVRDVELTANLGWASPAIGSALIMHN